MVEFKTGKTDSDDFDQRIENVEKQLGLYAIATREALGMDPTKSQVHFLSPEALESKEIDISQNVQESVRASVKDAVIGIKSGRFERKPSDMSRCSRCDLASVCPGSE